MLDRAPDQPREARLHGQDVRADLAGLERQPALGEPRAQLAAVLDRDRPQHLLGVAVVAHRRAVARLEASGVDRRHDLDRPRLKRAHLELRDCARGDGRVGARQGDQLEGPDARRRAVVARRHEVDSQLELAVAAARAERDEERGRGRDQRPVLGQAEDGEVVVVDDLALVADRGAERQRRARVDRRNAAEPDRRVGRDDDERRVAARGRHRRNRGELLLDRGRRRRRRRGGLRRGRLLGGRWLRRARRTARLGRAAAAGDPRRAEARLDGRRRRAVGRCAVLLLFGLGLGSGSFRRGRVLGGRRDVDRGRCRVGAVGRRGRVGCDLVVGVHDVRVIVVLVVVVVVVRVRRARDARRPVFERGRGALRGAVVRLARRRFVVGDRRLGDCRDERRRRPGEVLAAVLAEVAPRGVLHAAAATDRALGHGSSPMSVAGGSVNGGRSSGGVCPWPASDGGAAGTSGSVRISVPRRTRSL